ncbi:MAG: FAD-dependent monooxygenase [Acidimicrobiales bacterium]
MRIACIGGGPGGLFFATLAMRADPSREVVVFERNRAEEAFGFGVVFSDATMARIDGADPLLRRALHDHGVHWDEIEVRVKGERFRCAGNGMAAVARRTLLHLLQAEAAAAGADLRFETDASAERLLEEDYDLVVASDGANSRTRSALAEAFGPSADVARAKFIWFGTTYGFDALTFVHERGPDGVFAVHGYPIGGGVSTFIVETDEESWRRAALDEFDVDAPPGPSDEKSKDYLEKLFAEQIDGHALLGNNSRWATFHTRRCRTWSHGRVALLGDAAHTAHFSVGSGTKMAMEDAIALAQALDGCPGDLPAALELYEQTARPSVERIQSSARPSLSWWERFGLYHETLEPWQFAYHFLTRSIGDAKLRKRAQPFADDILGRWQRQQGASGRMGSVEAPPGVGRPAHLVLPGLKLPLLEGPPGDGSPWALLVEAPGREDKAAGIADAAAGVAVASGAALIAVSGGSLLTRRLVAEDLRLRHRLQVVLIEPGATENDVRTAVLSGRADAVAVPVSSPVEEGCTGGRTHS